ncbi:MAG: alpha/beta hydrolase [Bacteroidota bacterium]
MSPKETEKYFSENGLEAKLETYTVEDRTINFVHLPNAKQPTVIFFHGAPGSWSAFKHFMTDSLLFSSASLVSVDRPGYGYSNFGKSEPSLQRQSELIRPLLQKFSDTPTILVGHSLGGPVIAKLAMMYPNLVQGLIMVAPSIDPDLEPDEDWFRVPMRTPFISWMIPTSFQVTNEEIYFLEDELRNMLEGWSDIRVPTTIIQGNEDMLVNPANAAFGKRMLTNSPEVKLVIKDDLNHFIPWKNPQLIRSAILNMLAKRKGDFRHP